MTSLSDTGKIDPLLVLRGTAQLSVAPSADIVETGSPQPAGELLCGIGPLPVDLQLPLPCTVPAAVEEIHVIGTQSPVILRAPDAVGVLRLVQKDLSIQRRQLGHGIDVEHQQPAGGDEQVQPPEGAEVWWTDPEGEGVYVLVGEKIRRYNAQGTELTTPALARLTLQTDEKGKSTLTITDQDGRQLIQLTSTQPDPLHTESELRFDGDWFYWKTDEGSVLPCRITVE